MLSPWIDQIQLKTLLKFAPFGFLAGCGETSEYLAYACQIQPNTEEELFRRLNRQGEYYNTQINEVSFALSEITDAVNEISARLCEKGYVRVSFTYESEEKTLTIKEAIFNKPTPTLFDHSFLLLSHNGIVRLESYIDQYAPREIIWEDWREDLLKLVENPQKEWKRIFEVECDPCDNLADVEIIISN